MAGISGLNNDSGAGRSLILTLHISPEDMCFFDEQRQRYFPPERNYLKAHLTLFHQLPDSQRTREVILNFVHPAFDIEVSGLIFMGAGVAYHINSPALIALHQSLKHLFADHLIPQDKQGFRPHITVQNKVAPETARKLMATLSEGFKPFNIRATGLDKWAYLGGPWEKLLTVNFKHQSDSLIQTGA